MPIVVVLHERGGDAVSAIEKARTRFGRRADLVAPQAARPCNPFQSNHRDAAGYAGYSWYLGDAPEHPEAASFGDVLAELELFVSVLGRPFVLSGRGQGAVLASTLALHAIPDLTGVWSESSGLVELEGWALPDSPLDGVEFVFEHLEDSRISAARAVLEARGARILPASDSPERWLDSIAARGTTP